LFWLDHFLVAIRVWVLDTRGATVTWEHLTLITFLIIMVNSVNILLWSRDSIVNLSTMRLVFWLFNYNIKSYINDWWAITLVSINIIRWWAKRGWQWLALGLLGGKCCEIGLSGWDGWLNRFNTWYIFFDWEQILFHFFLEFCHVFFLF
jgi:hypothetical protein